MPRHFSGGGSFDDSDLFDVSGGDYKPDGGRSGGTMTVILCYFCRDCAFYVCVEAPVSP